MRDSAAVRAEHEPEFGGYTAWLRDQDGESCLMRSMHAGGGPRVFATLEKALAAARKAQRDNNA